MTQLLISFAITDYVDSCCLINTGIVKLYETILLIPVTANLRMFLYKLGHDWRLFRVPSEKPLCQKVTGRGMKTISRWM